MKLRAKKSLGQHFLNSVHVLEQIIGAADIKSDKTILEIGPGTGVLTEALLKTGSKVVAVEKDARAIGLLQAKFSNQTASGQLTLISADILTLPVFETLDSNDHHKSPNSTPKPYIIVANIPYYITGAILEKFLEHEPRPQQMVLLVQKEVADRIAAKETTDFKESILSTSVKAFGEPKIIAKVPRGAFTPPPNVDSAILRIDNISDKNFATSCIEIPLFFKILKAGFAHKRKYALNNLSEGIDNDPEIEAKLKEVWKQLSLDEKIRAERLTLNNWFSIASHLSK